LRRKQSGIRSKDAARVSPETGAMRGESIRVLIASASRETAEEVAGILQSGGYDAEWRWVDSPAGLASALDESEWDMILSDYGLPSLSVHDIMEEVRGRQSRAAVVVFSDPLPARSIVEIFRIGVTDYVPATEHGEMREAVERALQRAAAEKSAQQVELSFNEYRAYLEDLVTARAEELQNLNKKLKAEVDFHRATAQALRRSEESLRAITEAVPDIIAKFDRDLRHVYVNPAVEAVTGHTVGDYLGKTNRELGMPEHLCELWENLTREVFETGEMRESYFEFPSPGGTEIFHMLLAPEFSPSGEVMSVVSIARDVTDAKRAEAALRTSEITFKSLAENMPCMIIRVNARLEITYANPASECFTESGASEIKGKPVSDLGLPTAAARSLRAMFKKALGRGEWQSQKVRFKLGPATRTFDITVVPEMSDTGRPETALAMIHDISEAERAGDELRRDRAYSQRLVKERTAELAQTRVELEEAGRLSDVGTLAATVAHELRNPLAVIQTATYNIRKKRDNKGLDKHIASIEKMIAQSNQIISNLLNYSRLKEPRIKNTGLFGLIEECVAGAGERFRSQDIEITKTIDSIRGRHFLVDPDQFREVFVNIINNACEAFDGGCGRINVDARSDNGGKSLVMSISDNGPGMSPEIIRRSLDPFFTTKSRGTGLGLTICSDIIRLHGGTMSIESHVGRGTTVTIKLPAE
jgi:PAS domain S-box-containing protein